MPLLSFEHLVCRFGEIMAWHCLFEIEKAAGLRTGQFERAEDPEARLAYAQQLQDMARLTQMAA
jgi:hypothetical protein